MSKGNMLLGHARGKVGDLVFSRVNGQQVTRARAAVVKNPQTEPQIIQRIILNTISQAYSRMSAIADHSFEGVAQGQKSMSAFMKKNMSATRQRMTAAVNAGGGFSDVQDFAPIGTNNFGINPYIMATGTLPAVNVISVASATGAKIVAPAANTYQSFLDKYALSIGDQLTFCAITRTSEGDRTFEVCRVILEPADGNLEGTLITENAISSPNSRNEGGFVSLQYASDGITFKIGNETVLAACVIVSRQKTDGSWMRSNAQMVVDAAAVLALTDSYTLQAAIDQFYTDTLDLQSDLYLNNAVRKKAAAAAVSPMTFTTTGNPAETVSIVSLEVTDTAVIGRDAAGNPYIFENNNEDSSLFGKYLVKKNPATLSEAWSGTAPTVEGSKTLKIENYSKTGDPGLAQVNWFVSNGFSFQTFYVS